MDPYLQAYNFEEDQLGLFSPEQRAELAGYEEKEAQTQAVLDQDSYRRQIDQINKQLDRPRANLPQTPSGGGPLKNLGSNLLQVFKQEVGLAPTPQQRLRQMQMRTAQNEALVGQRDRLREDELRRYAIQQGVDPQIANTLSVDGLESLLTSQKGPVTNIPGLGQTQTNLSTDQVTVLGGQPTNDVKNYNFHIGQIRDLNKNLPRSSWKKLPTFEEYMEAKAQLGADPAAVKNWQFMVTQFPSLLELSEEEQLEAYMTMMRQGQDANYARAVAEAKSRGGAGGLFLTPGEKERDIAFSRKIVEYNDFGGDTQVRRNFQELEQIIKQLKAVPIGESSDLTGFAVASITNLGETATNMRSAESLNIQNMVERIVTQDLRQTLGAQFTEEEAKKFVGYAYNIALHPSVNAERLARMRNALRDTADAKFKAIRYFEDNNGSLQGYKSLSTFNPLGLELKESYGQVFMPQDFDLVDDNTILELLTDRLNDPNSPPEEFDVLLKVFEQRQLQAPDDVFRVN